MTATLSLQHVRKRYGRTTALDDVTLALPPGTIVGLIGRNGSGKSTLLRHATGLVLPTSGRVETFGVSSDRLDAPELQRIGVVEQHAKFIDWMRVEELIRYVARFYHQWDTALESRIVRTLEIDLHAKVKSLSPGNVQKLSLLLALCHHPALLLLDEPLSDLDPITREQVLALLLEQFGTDGPTMVVSSHLLHDIEPMVDRIVAIHEGRITAHEELDTLKERYAEWLVRAPVGGLPERFDEPYVLLSEGTAHEARVLVRDAGDALPRFVERYGAEVTVRPLGLERLFPILTAPLGVGASSETPPVASGAGVEAEPWK